jgi:anthranilate synthase component 1
VNREVFEQLKTAGYNRIPVFRSVLADLDTPLSVYLKLANRADSYLFESVEGGETWGRYSIIGLPSHRRFSLSGSTLTVFEDGKATSQKTVGDPLAYISALQNEFRSPRLDELPVFTGGLVGYFAYEIAQHFEARLADATKPDELGTPRWCCCYLKKWFLTILRAPVPRGQYRSFTPDLEQGSTGSMNDSAVARRWRSLWRRAATHADSRRGFQTGLFTPGLHPRSGKSKVHTVGDIFQVVLSQRMSVPLMRAWMFTACCVRSATSPYMFCRPWRHQVVGSPEVLVRVQQRRVAYAPLRNPASWRHAGRRSPAGRRIAERPERAGRAPDAD